MPGWMVIELVLGAVLAGSLINRHTFSADLDSDGARTR